MSGAKFGSEWTGDGDSGFDLAVSSAVLPVHGDGNDAEIQATS